MKKNSFLIFCFSFIPGAGQMYLGMMKRGVSLMLAFSLISMASGVLNLPILIVLLPVLWFYSFFDTFNHQHLSPEQRSGEDHFLFNLDDALSTDWLSLMRKRHLLVGGSCIALGIYLLYNSLLRPFLWWYADEFPWLGNLIRNIPSLIVAVAVIVLGVHLVRDKKRLPPLSSTEEDYVEYGGKNHG